MGLPDWAAQKRGWFRTGRPDCPAHLRQQDFGDFNALRVNTVTPNPVRN